ncbi:GP46-like surface antigen, putative, partial [Bodo saltans]
MFAMLTPLHSSSPYAAYVRPSYRFVCLYSTKVVFLCRHRLRCVSWVVFILFLSALTVRYPPHESVQLTPTSTWSSVLLVSASGNLCSCQGELSILGDFYVATNGASWKNSDGWNGDCNQVWFGIDCHGQHVAEINLPNNGLTRTLPDSLAALTGLTTLYLGINNIGGTLPVGWQLFASLTLLALYMNNITGTLPPQWGNMRTIETLSLYNNQLSGPLPRNWGSMSNLATLYLHNNLLSGSLPENWATSMTSLGNLYLDNNSLRGTLPALWSSLPLAVLSVSYNCLYGPVPLSYINLPLQIDGFRVCGTRITNATRCVAPCTNSTTTPAPANGGGSTTPYDNNTPWPAFCHEDDVASDSVSSTMSSSAEHISGAASTTASVTSTKMETHTMTTSSSGTNSGMSKSKSEISTSTSTSVSASLRRTVVSTSLSKNPSASHNLHATPTTSYDNAISQTSVVTQSSSIPSQTKSKRASTTTIFSSTTSRSAPAASTWVCGGGGMISPTNISVALMSPNFIPFLLGTGTTTTSVVVLQQDADQPSVISLSTSASAPLLRGDVTSRPLRRDVLLAGGQQPTTIVANISFSSNSSSSPLRWVISNVSTASMSLPGSTAPTALSRWVAETSNDVMWSTIAVEAPEGGWIPSNTPSIMDTSFIVTFTFSCDAGAVLEMVVTVPAPGNTLSIAGKVEAATRYSQIASVLAGGASSGSALGRVMATRSMVLCDADSAVGGGLIDFHFVRICTEDDGDSTRVVARGAVVSNIVVLAVVTTSLCMCAVAWMF